MKKSWTRKILGGLSLTSALFIFQACYGSPQDLENDFLIEGQVKSKTTGNPIPGIMVSVDNKIGRIICNNEGMFSIYTEEADSYTVLFEDYDGSANGSFLNRDTTVLPNIDKQVFLNIALEEK